LPTSRSLPLLLHLLEQLARVMLDISPSSRFLDFLHIRSDRYETVSKFNPPSLGRTLFCIPLFQV
jgi:hypothetical protein